MKKHKDEIKSEKHNNRMYKLVWNVIERMITRDGILLVLKDDLTDRCNRKLSVHFSYPSD